MTRAGKCQICRQRKVKCDESKPVCGPCMISGRPCSYNARRKDAALHLTSTRAAPSGAGLFQTFNIPPRTVSGSGARGIGAASRQSRGHETESLHLKYPDPLSMSSGRLSSRAFQAQILGQYMEIWLPQRRHVEPQLHTELHGHRAKYDWQTRSYDLAFTDPMLLDAVIGWCLVTLSNHGHDPHGYLRRLFYRRAYHRLRGRLQQPQQCLTDAVLATTMYLGYIEGVENVNTDDALSGCVTHVKGAAALIRARGKLNFETPFARELYQYQQIAQVCVFFYDTAVTEALDSIPEPGSPQLHPEHLKPLWRLPSLIAEANRVCQQNCDRTFDISLLHRLEELDVQLSTCLGSMIAEQKHWTTPSKLYNMSPNCHFPSYMRQQMCFQDVGIAREIFMCWTAALVLNETKGRLLRLSESREDAIYNTSRLETYSRGAEVDSKSRCLVERLLQSLEYFLHPDMGLSGVDNPDVTACALVLKSFVVKKAMAAELEWIKMVELVDSRASGRPLGTWLFTTDGDADGLV